MRPSRVSEEGPEAPVTLAVEGAAGQIREDKLAVSTVEEEEDERTVLAHRQGQGQTAAQGS